MSRPLVLVLGDQLSLALPSLRDLPVNAVVALCEVSAEGRYVPHHPQKIALILAAMRHFAAALRKRGYRVHYSALDDPDNTQELMTEAQRLAALHACDEIRVVRPGEWRLWQAMRERERAALPWRLLEDDRFYTTPDDFAAWAGGRESLRMEYFYREQRRRSGLLMEGDGPAGGRWNLDHDNREPLPAGLSVPAPPRHRHDATTRAVIALVAEHFGDHFGSLEGFHWPVTRRQALVDLRHFIEHLLPAFGRYQDAISDSEPFLFHSRLSAALNLGLLSPREVCEAAEREYHEGRAPLNSVEGFIRQVLGWREYVRGLYWTRMPDYKRGNALSARRGLPSFFWDGETEMRCLRRAIEMTRDNAYAHHIQRLMVTGNFALLCDVAPEALCDWYLAVYADACEWVELPNTLGMVLHADGGLMGSKPYCASGKYIDRMSDHCRHCRFDPKRATGPDACPFNSLYWDFLERHAETLSTNPRMKLIYGNLSRMSEEKRNAMRDQAGAFLEQLDAAPAYSHDHGQGEHRAGYAGVEETPR
ncbi:MULTISPECIES: cryptochrome/photolyase family protein [unclassified Halomonas]|uniref:cryptochrome/photolyase family protein n=1 Tax=unclassified Halomonas TaxID=2609666 RepID=UPI002886753D|nr:MULTISPECIES: cryptochrome/photolyase family protein [unclassified Halomonas]MDT0501978.1 cryptochrome/photolyase family protein [Halomonas sp. PAR7]MDT0511810.1 cryptochrome/photolyase family protein [Halomonas sp. LES1]MDT0592143.1 cryptochrome/photolyase family protein [Halomonas sp. PAR8]